LWGVVGDVYDNGPGRKLHRSPIGRSCWIISSSKHYTQTRYGVFVIRINRAGTAHFVAEARRAIWSVDANVPVFLTRTLQDI
jgi:hypothetical protein